MVALGPHLDAFVAELFGIEAETAALAQETARLDPVHACKRLFVQRQAVKKYADPVRLRRRRAARGAGSPHGRAADRGRLRRPRRRVGSADPEALDVALRYAAWATLTPEGQAHHRGGTLFRVPQPVDPQHLVPVETIERDGVTMLRLPEHDWRHRDGFALTDNGMNTQQALDQVNYCIWCHTQGKDSLQHRA